MSASGNMQLLWYCKKYTHISLIIKPNRLSDSQVGWRAMATCSIKLRETLYRIW